MSLLRWHGIPQLRLLKADIECEWLCDGERGSFDYMYLCIYVSMLWSCRGSRERERSGCCWYLPRLLL